jgi:hypothetical protein
MIAAITQAEVIRNILRYLKLAVDPPLLAPAGARQETFDWVALWVTCGQRKCVL